MSESRGTPVKRSVRLAELVATLSLAADLGLGEPVDHCMRQSVIALRLADAVGVDDGDRVATFYLALMKNIYCHADASEQAKWFGDDIALKSEVWEIMDMNTPQAISYLLRRVGSGENGFGRAKRLAAFPANRFQEMNRFVATHSALAAKFAEQIGLDEGVRIAVEQGFEQWDGKGPGQLSGEAVCLPSRLVAVASAVEVFQRRHGVEAARRMVKRQRGAQFDPRLADLFCSRAPELLKGLEPAASWDAIVDSEPELGRSVAGAELDNALEAMADLVDMKFPNMAGHSRGVANLAAEAGRVSQLPDEEVLNLRRAGLIHDLGRLGVSNAVWEKPGPLTEAELERVRMHPYLTERILANVEVLASARELAVRHHERLDGSGYPRRLAAAALSPSDRLLAAADSYHAMTEPRPHREALEPDAAADQLRAEAKAGRLDGNAVNAVLNAAGHRAPARREWPAGLTAREVEVLGQLARGHSNKEIAEKLTVTPKTVSSHVEHIYRKIDVSSRAAATLFATQHGLVGSFEPA